MRAEPNPHRGTSIAKYYSEERTGEVRLALEKQIVPWPHVTAKRMFGCPSYAAAGKLFAFLVTDGIVITHLTKEDRETLAKRFGAAPFRGRNVVSAWPRVPVRDAQEVAPLLPYVRRSYENALAKS